MPSCTRRPLNFIRDFGAIALLWALVIACFWKITLAGRVLAGGDVFTYFYPYWAEATRAIRAARLPLWNPYLFMGVPFLANSQVGFFYPLNWLLWLLLPAHRSLHLTIALHLCLAALNGYLWGQSSLRLGRAGAWTVGATFALGGYLGAQVEHVNQLQGLAWLPLMLFLWDKISDPSAPAEQETQSPISNPDKAAFIGLAVVIGLVLLAGHTQTAFISLVGVAIYGLGPTLWRAVRQREWGALARGAALLAAAAGLGAALAAVQLIPTWELARFSVRAGGLPFKERVSFSLSPFYLARALLPGFEAVPPEHIEHVAYVSVAGLALATAATSSLKSQISSSASRSGPLSLPRPLQSPLPASGPLRPWFCSLPRAGALADALRAGNGGAGGVGRGWIDSPARPDWLASYSGVCGRAGPAGGLGGAGCAHRGRGARELDDRRRMDCGRCIGVGVAGADLSRAAFGSDGVDVAADL